MSPRFVVSCALAITSSAVALAISMEDAQACDPINTTEVSIIPSNSQTFRERARFFVEERRAEVSTDNTRIVGADGTSYPVALTPMGGNDFSTDYIILESQNALPEGMYTLERDAADFEEPSMDSSVPFSINRYTTPADVSTCTLTWDRVTYSDPFSPDSCTYGVKEISEVSITCQYYGATEDVYLGVAFDDANGDVIERRLQRADKRPYNPAGLEPPMTATIVETLSADSTCVTVTPYHISGFKGAPQTLCMPTRCAAIDVPEGGRPDALDWSTHTITCPGDSNGQSGGMNNNTPSGGQTSGGWNLEDPGNPDDKDDGCQTTTGGRAPLSATLGVLCLLGLFALRRRI